MSEQQDSYEFTKPPEVCKFCGTGFRTFREPRYKDGVTFGCGTICLWVDGKTNGWTHWARPVPGCAIIEAMNPLAKTVIRDVKRERQAAITNGVPMPERDKKNIRLVRQFETLMEGVSKRYGQ